MAKKAKTSSRGPGNEELSAETVDAHRYFHGTLRYIGESYKVCSPFVKTSTPRTRVIGRRRFIRLSRIDALGPSACRAAQRPRP